MDAMNIEATPWNGASMSFDWIGTDIKNLGRSAFLFELDQKQITIKRKYWTLVHFKDVYVSD